MEKNKIADKYRGKRFSILGDSISTFEDCNPPFYPVYYKHEVRERNGLVTAQDTWWHKVIDYFGGTLLVNGGWSGGTVVKITDREDLFPSGCSERRIEELSRDGIDPDVIIVYLGTNDWGYGCYGDEGKRLENFPFAYSEMLKKIKQRYKDAEVWCLSINRSFCKRYPGFVFDECMGDRHIEIYNDVIKRTATEHGCIFVDIYSNRIPYDTCDGIHPNRDGMITLAELCIKEIEEIQRKK